MVPVSVRQSQLEYLDLDLDQGPSAGRNAPPPSTAPPVSSLPSNLLSRLARDQRTDRTEF